MSDKVAVLAFGGETTAKVAAKIANEVGAKVCKSAKELTDEAIVVVGTHIRMGKFDNKFVRFAKKYSGKVKIFTFLVGAAIESKQKFIEKAQSLTGDRVWYVWGELNVASAKGLKRFALQAFADGRRQDGLPAPRLLEKEINALCRAVCEEHGTNLGE